MQQVQEKKKQKKWIQPRHRVIRDLAYGIIGTYTRWKYGVTVEKFKDGASRPYLILFNHQTAFDQFMVGMAFDQPVYYVASEDLFSNGLISRLLRWAVAPIPIKKQTTDLNAVMNCIRVAREGGTIAIAPEGNRTFSGKTVYMSDAIAPLARKLKLPIALYRLEGGYGIQPRWSDVTRKGKMRGYVSRVMEPEEYAGLSNEALFAIIEQELQVDETAQAGPFRGSRRAEYLERAMYVCPKCGLTTFESRGNEITCRKCGLTVTYGQDQRLAGPDFPFPYVKQWYEYQEDYVNRLDVLSCLDTPLYTDTADVSEVIVYSHKEKLGKNVTVSLYGDRMVLDPPAGEQGVFPFDEVSAITVLGKNKLNIYFNKRVFQLKSHKRFNALKYVNIYHRYKNMRKGDGSGKFLGL